MQINIFSPLSNQSHYQTLVWSAEGLRGSSLCIWKKCPAPALQAENSLLPGFYVITLTFNSGWEQLPPQQTGVCACVCLWAITVVCCCRLGIYTILLLCPDSLLYKSIQNIKPAHTSFNHNPQNSGCMYQKNLRDERVLSLHSMITLWSMKLAAFSLKFFFSFGNPFTPSYRYFFSRKTKFFHLSWCTDYFSSLVTAKGGRTLQKVTDLHLEQLSNKTNKCQESVWV